MESPNLTEENIAKIGQLFPECLTEKLDEFGKAVRAIDFDVLRDCLSNTPIAEDDDSRYMMTWPGKRTAHQLAYQPTTATLLPCPEESVDFDTTKNLYIEGDNLEVLKLLRETYLGKVKMIYIDPPYNTGKDFLYSDNYIQSQSDYDGSTDQYDDDGNRLVRNTETNGKYHTDWLNMIYPRLLLARDFLSKDGVIFISIDDNEIDNLKKISNQIFGEQNYLGTLVIRTATDNNAGQVKIEHEYIVCYAKTKSELPYWFNENDKAKLIQEKFLQLKGKYVDDIENIQIELRKWIKNNKKELDGVTQYDNVDSKGVFHDGDIANTVYGGYNYNIIHPVTGKVCKIPDKGFRYPKETMMRMIENDDIMFGNDETTLIKPKRRVEDVKDLLRSVIYEDGRASTKKFESLMARDIFSNPKSVTILERIFNFIVNDDDIIMDFFSGSGTTAETVMQLNADKEKHLKFIMVQLREDLDITYLKASDRAKKTIKNAINFLDGIGKPHTIPEIGKERIRRAGTKIKQENPLSDVDIGFRVLKTASSNMKDVYYKPSETKQTDIEGYVDNIKSDRKSFDLLFQVMLEFGITLDVPITTKNVKGLTIYQVAGNSLSACFDKGVDEEIIKEMAKDKPLYAAFRDVSYREDQTKINVEQIFKQLSPNTKIYAV